MNPLLIIGLALASGAAWSIGQVMEDSLAGRNAADQVEPAFAVWLLKAAAKVLLTATLVLLAAHWIAGKPPA